MITVHTALTRGAFAFLVLTANCSASENLHAQKGVRKQTLTTEVGLLRNKIAVTTLSAPGDSWEQVLDLGPDFRSETPDPMVLEIDEVHQARPQAFLYTIYVDDKPVYVRTFAELLKAPYTAMVAFDRKLVGNPRQVRVRLTRGEGAPVSIARVRLHGDFYAQARAQGMDEPMGVYDYVGHDFERAKSVRERYPDSKRFRTGAMFGFRYLDRGRAELAADLDRVLDLVGSQHLPFAVMFSRWWGHTATSSDGLGGNYGDLVYNQITLDPVTHALAPTTPNIWGNTPWPSLQHERVNRIAQELLGAATNHFADRYALLSAHSTAMPPAAFVMEWGSGYWEYGDMSRRVRNAARADEVVLRAEDGLDSKEIAWMQRNIATYNNALAQAYASGLGSDAVVVQSGTNRLPDQQLAKAVFTHTLHGKLYPSYDDRLPGWVGGVGPLMWPSSEMYAFSDDRHHQYSLSQGRLACVNLEMTMLKAQQFSEFLGRAYAHGMDFLVMFNPDGVKYSVAEQIATADTLENQPCPDDPTYCRHLLDIDYLRDSQAGDPLRKASAGIAYEGLALVPPTDMRSGFVHQAKPGEPGTITLRLKGSFVTGLRLEVEACAKGGTVSIMAGPSQERLAPVTTLADGQQINWFNRHTLHRITLDDQARGQSEFIVQIRLEGTRDTASIRAVRAFLPWAEKAGRVDFRPDTYGERRLQSRWIQSRVVLERLRHMYLSKRGEPEDGTLAEAARLEKEGRLGEAARLLSAAISQKLPARFTVAEGGRLEPFPLEVRAPGNTVLLTVLESKKNRVRLRAVSAAACELEIRPTQPALGLGTVTQNEDGSLLVEWSVLKDNTSTEWTRLPVACLGPVPPAVRAPVVRIARVTSDALWAEVPGLPPGSGDRERVRLPLAKGWKSTRISAESEPGAIPLPGRPQPWDRARIQFNEQGDVTEVAAEFGLAQGKIASYEPPNLKELNPHNGLLRLENGMVFEFSFAKDHTQLALPPLKGLALDYHLSELKEALQKGRSVRVQYAPPVHAGATRRIVRLEEL